MSSETNKSNEPEIQAADSKELSDNDLANVTGGDKAAPTANPKETVTFNYGSLQVKYVQQKPD